MGSVNWSAFTDLLQAIKDAQPNDIDDYQTIIPLELYFNVFQSRSEGRFEVLAEISGRVTRVGREKSRFLNSMGSPTYPFLPSQITETRSSSVAFQFSVYSCLTGARATLYFGRC